MINFANLKNSFLWENRKKLFWLIAIKQAEKRKIGNPDFSSKQQSTAEEKIIRFDRAIKITLDHLRFIANDNFLSQCHRFWR